MDYPEDIAVCRTCLGRERLEHMKDLQETVSFINYSTIVTLEDVLYEITGMIINKCEKITQLICSSCVGKLRAAYRFKLMAARSYEKLCQVPSEDFLPHKPCRAQVVDMESFDKDDETGPKRQNFLTSSTVNNNNNVNQKTYKPNYFQCDLCSASYPRLFYMRTHMKRFHTCK